MATGGEGSLCLRFTVSQVFDFGDCMSGSLNFSLELSEWPLAFLFCLIFYSLNLLLVLFNI